jgi:hypothetical protein
MVVVVYQTENRNLLKSANACVNATFQIDNIDDGLWMPDFQAPTFPPRQTSTVGASSAKKRRTARCRCHETFFCCVSCNVAK